MKYLLSVALVSLAICLASAQATPGVSATPSSILLSQPDFNGDGRAELVLRRIDNHLILVVSSAGRTDFNTRFGRLDSDMPVIGDFDGDGTTDLAVRRLGSATWKVKNSSGSNYNSTLNNGEQWVVFGRQKQDIPAVGDYDGDGISDFAVFRPETQIWYIRNSSLNNYNSAREDGIQRIKLGEKTSLIPVPGDYDGDSITDMALFDAETSQWLIRYSSQPLTPLTVNFGSDIKDIPVVADYDGDGKTDIALWKPETLTWEIKESATEQVRHISFGYYPADIPIAADYDGDGLADPALRGLSDRQVHILNSSDNQLNSFRVGEFDDIPVNAPAYLVMRMIQDQDIMLDTDGDGISDKAEVEVYGTNPYLRDSDGDGLSDSDEINLYNTDPLDTDSDNDGVEDGDEVSITTDPNDPDSVNLPRATTQVNMTMNLPAAVSPIDANRFDPNDPGTYHASTSIDIYDSLGNPHTQTFYFVKDANAPTVNEWLIATSIDDIFYDFANFDGSVPGAGTSNSHGNIAAVPPVPADSSSNVLGFSQTLPVDDGAGQTTIRNTGLWATRVIFNSSGELIEIQSADGRSLPVVFPSVLNLSTDGFIPIPTTIPLTGFRNSLADKTQTIGLEMHFESDVASGFKPTQYALPFEVFKLSHNGLPGFTDGTSFLVDTDGDGLSDFAELNIHSTNPLLTDTDGDGDSDGVEVERGTNPAKDNNFVAPLATSVVTMRMNLPAAATSLNANNFNPIDESTYSTSVSDTIYDSLGNAHTQIFYFIKDANAPTMNEWLMVTSVDGIFYDFLRDDGSEPNQGRSNSPGAPQATPPIPADESNNTVGFGQSLPVNNYYGTTERYNGIVGTRLIFDGSGDLQYVGSGDSSLYWLDYPTPVLPTTIELSAFDRLGAYSYQHISVDFKVDYDSLSPRESTQWSGPFELFYISQDGYDKLSNADTREDRISIPDTESPVATQTVTMRMNLPAGATSLDANNFNPNDSSTFTGISTIDIYDSLGNTHTQTFYFLKDANAPTANEWLMVTAIDDLFYDFFNSDGSITNPGRSNSPGSFGTLPLVAADISNNTVGFSQNLPIFDLVTIGSRNTGVWATRLVFDTSGDLILVESADGVSVPGLSISNLFLPTTNFPIHFWNYGAEVTHGIQINFSLDLNSKSADEPEQSGFPFEVFTINQDGRAAFSQQ